MGVDEIWIGNLAYYNEGYLVGDWLKLPCDPGRINDFLKESVLVDHLHEEVAIFDTSFGGPLGKIGYRCGEWDSIEELNALSWILDGLAEERLDAIGAYISERCDREDPIEVANVALQAEEIYWHAWPDDGRGYSCDEERLAHWFIDEVEGGIERMDEDTLRRHFDYKSYGVELARTDVDLGSEGGFDFWAWTHCDELDCNRFSSEEIHEMAGQLGYASSWYSEKDTGHAAEVLREVGSIAASSGDPRLLLDAALIIEGMSLRNRHALAFYSQYHMGPVDGPLEYANAALQAQDLSVWDVPDGNGGIEERLGTHFAAEHGLSEDDLTEHFDYKSYGYELAQGDFTCCSQGVLEADASEVDLNRYDWRDVCEEAFAPKKDDSRLEELESECACYADIQAVANERAVGRPR